jgi:hypothetical protein
MEAFKLYSRFWPTKLEYFPIEHLTIKNLDTDPSFTKSLDLDPDWIQRIWIRTLDKCPMPISHTCLSGSGSKILNLKFRRRLILLTFLFGWEILRHLDLSEPRILQEERQVYHVPKDKSITVALDGLWLYVVSKCRRYYYCMYAKPYIE